MQLKIKHLEFIQNTINRMSNNSFLLKGWSMTLVGALFVFVMKESNEQYLYISTSILLIFWILDSYFLSRERLFVKLFDNVRILEEKNINFSMSIKKFENGENWTNAFFSKTLILFYGGILLSHLLLIYLI